jgi:hypothetical protein
MVSEKRKRINNLVFGSGLIFTLVIPVFLQLYYHDSTAAWISLLCGAFVTIMQKFEDIVELSFGPIKARMKETIKEATATIEQLQRIAKSQSKAMLTEMMASSFMGGTKFSNKIDLHDEVISNLKVIGISESEISEIDEMWKRGMNIMYLNTIKVALEGRRSSTDFKTAVPEEVSRASTELSEMMDFSKWIVPTPDEIEGFISRKGLMNDVVSKKIDDYRTYKKEGRIVNRDMVDWI